MKSKLNNIPEKTFDEWVRGTSEAKPFSHYLPKPKGKTVQGTKGTEKKSEDSVKDECIRWLKLQGWKCRTIYTGGIPTQSGRRIPNPAKGIPDCICFKAETMVYIEWKKSHGGILSVEQQEWHSDLRRCNQIVFVITSLEQLKKEFNETFI